MITFLSEVLVDLIKKDLKLSDLTFIVPSRRASVLLKHELSILTNKTIFSTEIVSIETFTEKLSQLKPISNTELLFQFYETYTKLTPNL